MDSQLEFENTGILDHSVTIAGFLARLYVSQIILEDIFLHLGFTYFIVHVPINIYTENTDQA